MAIDGSPSCIADDRRGLRPVRRIPRHTHVRHVVGHSGTKTSALTPVTAAALLPDFVRTPLELPLLARVILPTNNSSAASMPTISLCSPSSRGRSRCHSVSRSDGRRRQRLLPSSSARALRSAMPLPPENAKGRSPWRGISTGCRRREVGRRVIQRRNRMLRSELDEFLVPNLPFLVVVVVEEHHRGLVAHRASRILACLDLHRPDAAVAHGALVPNGCASG